MSSNSVRNLTFIIDNNVSCYIYECKICKFYKIKLSLNLTS